MMACDITLMAEEKLIHYLENIGPVSFFDEEAISFFCVSEEINEQRGAEISRSLDELKDQLKLVWKRMSETRCDVSYREAVQELFETNQKQEAAECFRKLKQLRDLLNRSLDCIEEKEGRVFFNSAARDIREGYPQQGYYYCPLELLSAAELYFLLHYAYWSRIGTNNGLIYDCPHLIPKIGQILQALREKMIRYKHHPG